MSKRRKPSRKSRHRSKLGKRIQGAIREKFFEKTILKEFFEKNNIKQVDTGKGTGFFTDSILDANSSSTPKVLEVKFQSKLQDIASRIQKAEQETGYLQRNVDFLIKRGQIKRPISILGRGSLVSKKIKDIVDLHKLKHKCDIAYILLDKFRQLDKEGKQPNQFELKEFNVPFSWELGNWCQKLNVRPAEAVRYIVEGMTKSQARKLLHWTERSQNVEGFADPETIAIIELVDAYDNEIKKQPDLLLKTFYETTYKNWFKKFMDKEKYPSYNSFSEWFKWARKRAVAIRRLHQDLLKYSAPRTIKE
jgi:hypothetical protein